MLPVRDSLPTRSVPGVNYALIALNVGVFGLEVWTSAGGGQPGALREAWALVPAQLTADPLANAPSLLGHMFLHAGFEHLAGNMLFLWIFGDNVEDALGHARYAFFYLACGLAAALAQVAASPASQVPMVGASGAIAGVLAAYGILYPRSPITVLNPIPLMWLFWGLFISLPAWFVILEFFAVNLWSALQPANPTGGVAFVAHVGGFVSGLLLLPLLRKEEPVDHDNWDRMLGPRLRR
jgi:membrane associated rhomboid family serine protease